MPHPTLTFVNVCRRVCRLNCDLKSGIRGKGTNVVTHKIEAEPEVYGAATYLIIVHMVRNFAGRDAASRRVWTQLLETAARDAEKLNDDFGKKVAALIRRVLIMKPLLDTSKKN
jgi:hypothetical protein